MNRSRPAIAPLALAFLTSALLAAPLSGCKGEQPVVRNADGEVQENGFRYVRYTVRAQITALPAQGTGGDLMAHHEPIPEFRGNDGSIEGMNEMTMPFPIGEGVSTEGLAVGDKVAITFEVTHAQDWKLQGYEIVSWEKLPADTTLNFAGVGPMHEHEHGEG